MMKHFKKPFYLLVFSGILSTSSLAQAASVDALIAAVIRDSDMAVQAQIEQGVDPNARDAKGRTPLTLAIQNDSGKIIPLLLQSRKIDINATNAAEESPLMLAIIKGQNELAQTLMRRGADINKAGWAPLHYAATASNLDMIRVLLDKDAYIDTQSPNETTPLMMAAQYGNEQAVLLLLQKGADPWAKNQLGLTPLDFARKGNKPDSITAIQAAQRRRKPDYNAKPLAPLSAASAAQLKGLPVPENPEEPELIYPEGMEPPPPAAPPHPPTEKPSPAPTAKALPTPSQPTPPPPPHQTISPVFMKQPAPPAGFF